MKHDETTSSFCPVKYAKGRIASEDYPPSAATLLTYKSFLKDYIRSRRSPEKFGYVFDAFQANKWQSIIQFLARLPVDGGDNAPVQLLDWQLFTIHQLFGWVTFDTVGEANPRRRYHEAYLEMGKKNGKTTFIAILALAHLLFERQVKDPSVYCFASTLVQARVCLDTTKKIARNSVVGVRRHVKVMEKAVRLDEKERGGFITALPSTLTSAEGIQPSLVIRDEWHAKERDPLLVRMRESMPNRANPLLLIITTAGTNKDSDCFKYRQAKLDELNLGRAEKRTFCYIHAADAGDDWHDESVYYKANPSLRTAVMFNDIVPPAYEAAHAVAEFKAARLGLWTNESEVAFCTTEEWDACTFPSEGEVDVKATIDEWLKEGEGDLYGGMGLDIGRTGDFTALSIVIYNIEQDIYLTFTRHLTTAHMLRKSQYDPLLVDLQPFVDAGELVVAGDDLVDDAAIIGEINRLFHEYPVGRWAFSYDKWQATRVVSSLLNEHRYLERNTRPMVASPYLCFGNLQRLIKQRRILHEGSALLGWEVGNLTMRTTRSGYQSPQKGTHVGKKIDGVMSMGYAIDALNNLQCAPEMAYQQTR